MLRVLMVLEDYGELMFLQTVLKKLGFDVDSIQNPRSFSDSVLAMNPDILVVTANGKRVKGVELSRTVRRTRNLPRIIALRAVGAPEDPSAEVDGWLETPVAVMGLVELMAKLANLDMNALREKFLKLHMPGIDEEKARILKLIEGEAPVIHRSPSSPSGGLPPSTMTASERQERHKKFLEEKPPDQHGFTLKAVQDQVRNLREMENPADLDELERQRKAFVEQLFKKKGG